MLVHLCAVCSRIIRLIVEHVHVWLQACAEQRGTCSLPGVPQCAGLFRHSQRVQRSGYDVVKHTDRGVRPMRLQHADLDPPRGKKPRSQHAFIMKKSLHTCVDPDRTGHSPRSSWGELHASRHRRVACSIAGKGSKGPYQSMWSAARVSGRLPRP